MGKTVDITKRDRKILENLIARNGYRTILCELKHYAFARINNQINKAWADYYRGISQAIREADLTNVYLDSEATK